MTDYGAKAAASHTGALTSSSAVFSAAARQSGMIVTTDPDEFMDLTFALAYMPLPPGKRVAVATMGGGWGVLVSDEIARCGLELRRSPRRSIAGLNGLLPPYWSHSNPMDLVATLTPGVPEAVVEMLAASDSVDAVMVMGVIGSMSESRRALREIERLKQCAGPARRSGERAGCDAEEAEPELSERELAFIKEMAALMDRYCKPIVEHLVQADDPGRVLRGRQVLHVRASVAAAGREDAGEDGGLQPLPAEEGPRPGLLRPSGAGWPQAAPPRARLASVSRCSRRLRATRPGRPSG